MWGRFFRNAELERMVDQDLSRLYPEHGSYFQTPGCQAMLRRILLLWCLGHPGYGYRQGMLKFVLHLTLMQLLSSFKNSSFYGFSIEPFSPCKLLVTCPCPLPLRPLISKSIPGTGILCSYFEPSDHILFGFCSFLVTKLKLYMLGVVLEMCSM